MARLKTSFSPQDLSYFHPQLFTANSLQWNRQHLVSAHVYNTPYAVPFSALNKTVSLPDKRQFPKVLRHIGDHIKKARLDNRIPIKDVLNEFQIDRETLRAWELGLWEPFVKHYPKIICFLGYYPLQYETETLGGKIKKYRYEHGLTQEQFAVLLNTDKCTVSFWETNRRLPLTKTVLAIEKILR